MKKILLTVSIFCFATVVAFAQMSGGAKAGLNLANAAGKDAGGTDMRVGFHVGGYLNFGISDAFSIQPELLFNSVGAKETSDGTTTSIALNYISIPVMFKYNIVENFNIQAGPQLGILASAKAKFDGGDLDIKDGFNSTDFGLNLGLGVDFGSFNATARYSLGLSTIAKSDNGDNVDIKNNVIQISLGYKLFGGE